MYDAVREMGTTPQCELLADLVIHPTFVCGIGFTGAPSAPGAPVPAPKRP
jgi:hypothetical protein